MRGKYPSSSVNVLHRCRWDLRNLQTGRQHRAKKADGTLPSRRTFICEFFMHAFPRMHLQIYTIMGFISTLVANIEHRSKKTNGTLPSQRTSICELQCNQCNVKSIHLSDPRKHMMTLSAVEGGPKLAAPVTQRKISSSETERVRLKTRQSP